MKLDSNAIYTVIVTRPEPDHANLMQSLAALNHAVIHAPAFDLLSKQVDMTAAQKIELLEQASGLIVVSPMAARTALKVFSLEHLRDALFFAPGAATASVLEAKGLQVRVPVAHATSEAILALPELNQIEGQTFVLLKAAGGRELIAKTLEDRGASVVIIELYQRRACTLNQEFLHLLARLKSERSGFCTLISSGAAFDVLSAQLSKAQLDEWLKGWFIVSSARLAKHLKAAGVARLRVASSAADADMLAAFESLR